MTVEPIYFETYLAVIKNSVGSRAYRNFLAFVNGERKDILEDGKLSCAYFVSTILHQFLLIKTPHTGINGTLKDMEEEGWIRIEEPKEGAVILWEKDQGGHKHLGFYVGNNMVISHREIGGCPVEHDLTYDNTRKIEAIYWCLKWK